MENRTKEGGTPLGWRSKLVFLLIVYGAGFATAVYCLSPPPEADPGEGLETGRLLATFRSEEFTRSVNSGMHKAIAFGKEAATKAAEAIREKIDEAQAKSKG